MERKHGSWAIRSSERLYADEFAEVWVDEVSRPDGEPARRVTMRMKPGVAVLALDGEGFAHLVRTFRYAVGKESVEVVQGGVEEGEEPGAAARRELKEELGIEAETEATESLEPVKVKLEEAVRMVMDAEITQGLSCALILKAKLLLEGESGG